MSRPRPRCPVCGVPVRTTAVRGRPRVYCGDRCRWKAGHAAAGHRAREQRRQWMAEWAGMTPDEQFAALAAAMPR